MSLRMHETNGTPINQRQFRVIHPSHVRRRRIVRIATVLYTVYVKTIPYAYSLEGTCLSGVLCKISHIKDNETIWTSTCCTGMVIDIFEMVARGMDIEYEMYIVEDGNFGALRNGSWNGMMNELNTKRADIAVQMITATAERLAIADFTVSVIGKPMYLTYVTRKETAVLLVLNWAFARSLDRHLLLGVGLIIITLIVVIISLEYIVSKYQGTKLYPATEAFSYMSGILFQRDLGSVMPPHSSARFISIVYAFGMTLFISSYTAQLTAENIGPIGEIYGVAQTLMSGIKRIMNI
jgi:hypothetical protein